MTDKHGVGTFVNEATELATDALDLFNMPAYESALIAGKTQIYYPTGVITDAGPYEFLLPNDNNEYTMMDLVELYGEVEVLQTDGDALENTDIVSVINNFPQTLFRQVEVYLNNICVSDLTMPTYPYKAYIENHLTYDKDLKDTTLLARELYLKDTINLEDNSATAGASATSGFMVRRSKIAGRKYHFMMKLHVDFLQCRRFLIPGVEMKIRLVRSDDNFSLHSATSIAKIKMHNLELHVRRISADPVVAGKIESVLSSRPAIYPVANSKIKTYLLNAGISSQNLAQVVRGKLPRSLIIGMVRSRAFDGDIAANPFFFQNFTLNYLNLFINGEPITPKAIMPQWDNGSVIKLYSWFLNNLGLHQNVSNAITMEEWKTNSCFFPFDLTPDLCNNYYGHGIENGTIDISLAFKTALTENVTVVLYMTYDEQVVIDKDRNVVLIN